MADNHPEQLPKLHNAAWPGVVGKGQGGEPPIDLDTMLDLTAAAEVDGVRFDGFDLFLFDPHISIDADDGELRRLTDKARARKLEIGTVVAPVWGPTGGGSAMGDRRERENFLTQVKKGCRIAQKLRELGIRPNGAVRIDSACGVEPWCEDPKGNQKRIAETFREACNIAEDHGERLAAEGEICWGGMHSWRRMIELLEMVDRPKTLGFQADMAHTLLYLMGYNAPEDALLPQDFDWRGHGPLRRSLCQAHCRVAPWTIDFHVAQNDGTVHGSGSHDKTGRHCLATDPERQAGHRPLRPASGCATPTAVDQAIRHVCWDGCMFPNAVMMKRETWNEILRAMIAVRDAHGWKE